MNRLFLDANVLFSAAYSSQAGVRCLWRLSGVELLTSAYAAEEARRNLDPSQRHDLETLLTDVLVSEAAPQDRPITGAADLHDKDRPILLAAVDSGATHLITGDFTHFGPYYGTAIEGVLIVTPATYLAGRSA